MAQVAAGVLIVVFGPAQLGVPGFRGITVTAPAWWSRFVRGRARSRSTLAPAVLGLPSVLIPFGVTLSMEVLELSAAATAGAALPGNLRRLPRLRRWPSAGLGHPGSARLCGLRCKYVLPVEGHGAGERLTKGHPSAPGHRCHGLVLDSRMRRHKGELISKAGQMHG